MAENSVTNLRVKKSLDAKIKEIANKKGRTKTEIYEEAVLNYIEMNSKEELIRDSKIEELLNRKISNVDKHLSSMLGQLSKDLALVYCTSIFNLQKTLDLLGLDTKNKYTDMEIMKIMESRGDLVHNHLMMRARNNKENKLKAKEEI